MIQSARLDSYFFKENSPCRNYFHIFYQAICKTFLLLCYCCGIWPGPTSWISLHVLQSIIKCDVFIFCNLFSSSLLHTFPYWFLWMVCTLLLCCKWFSGVACLSLTTEALTWIAALSEDDARTWVLILWIMPLALINILLPQHLPGIVWLSPTHSWEAVL